MTVPTRFGSVPDRPQVTFFQRKPRKHGNYSMEIVFEGVRSRLLDEIEATVNVAPFVSKGLLRRLGISLQARFRKGSVNHVTGDIHFVTMVLPRGSTVLTIHDCGSIVRSRGWRHHLLRVFWLSWPLRSTAVATTVSQASKKEIMRLARCSPDKIRVIPDAVPDVFQFRPKSFDKRCPRILQVGTALNKNVPRLAQALRGLSCKLVVIGSLASEVEDALVGNGVDFEQRENLPMDAVVAEYERADIVSFVSTHEGFGMPILEANAVGRPVICGDTASMPEVAMGAACLVDPYDVPAIRAGIERIISDDRYREDLVRRGRENVKRFDPDRIARQYLAIYREIAGGRPR